MSLDTLPNYIRSARKATGLTVKDLARLMGSGSGSSVSHYEAFRRLPSLESAFILRIALERELHELFPGMDEELRLRIRERAELILVEDTPVNPKSPRERARQAWLSRLAGQAQLDLDS